MRGPNPPFPSRAVMRQERTQRRRLVLGLATLLVLATAPLFAHHLRFVDVTHLGATDHLLALCLTALHALLEPVHIGSHLLFFAGVAYASWDRASAWRAMRRTLRTLPAESPSSGSVFAAAARATGVDPRVLRVVRGLPSPAFTAGWLRPRVYLAERLGAELTPAELRAVIAHEGAHVARHDPLRLSAIRFLSRILFWIPAFASLARDMEDEAEILADDVAAREDPLALASAILRLGAPPPPPAPVGAVGFDRPDLLERRIRRLAGENVAPPARLPARRLLPAAVVLLLVWSSGAMVLVHPHPHGVVAHCEHHDSPVTHILCPALAAAAPAEKCPHRHLS